MNDTRIKTSTGSPAYKVTPLDNFDRYEGAGVPTPCRDAEHALSVSKGILERSLAHEHNQAKDPSSPEELFKRWDDFGDYPSIRPELDPPFNPSEYARQRAAEICSAHQASDVRINPKHHIHSQSEPDTCDTMHKQATKTLNEKLNEMEPNERFEFWRKAEEEATDPENKAEIREAWMIDCHSRFMAEMFEDEIGAAEGETREPVTVELYIINS